MSFLSASKEALGTENNPAPSAQAIVDDDPNVSSGTFFVDIDNVGPKEVFCEFINGQGFVLAANTDMGVRNNTLWTWNDISSWRRSGSDYGSVSDPYNPSSPQYRDKDVWNNYKGTKVGIKVHDGGSMFGNGSYVFFNLLSSQSNKSWSELMDNNGGLGGGDQITEDFFDQAGMDTSGSGRNTSGHLSPELDYCTIARSMPGHLRVNHIGGNNGMRILGSNQFLETSNDDATRGIGSSFAVNTDGDIESTDPIFNGHGCPTEVDQPENINNSHRMYPPFTQYPDGSNSNVVGDAGDYNTQPPEFNYAILID